MKILKTVFFKTSLILFFITSFTAKSAFAEEKIFDKYQADYNKNKGIRLGSFIAVPSIVVEEKFDDNIYSRSNNKTSDFINIIRPNLEIKSNWNVHKLEFNVGGDIGSYFHNDGENYQDYDISVKSQSEISRQTYLIASAYHKYQHEDRGNPDRFINANAPTFRYENNFKVGFARSLRKMSFSIDQGIKSFDYLDAKNNQGNSIDNDFRDRKHYDTNAKIAYEFIPNYKIFLKGSINQRKYDNIDRDSSGKEISTGFDLKISGKTKANIYLGHLEQNYDSISFKDISGLLFGGNFEWSPNRLSLIKAGVKRSIEETAIVGFSGYLATSYSLAVKYELLSNLMINSDISISNNDYYTNLESGRSDKFRTFKIEAKYLLNRNMAANIGYTNSRNATNSTSGRFIKNMISASLEIKF